MTRRIVLSLALVAFLAVLLPAVRADDVPEDIRDLYREALEHEATGDLKKAYSVLSKARAKDPESVDFWELYVRVWRGLDKKEDVLWDKIVGKAEKKSPRSPVFELLRARLAEDTPTRLAHLRAAVAKDPAAVGPQLLLAKAVLADGDDIEAEEILQRVLEQDPKNEEALVVRGELDLDAGRTLSALSFAEEQLETHDLPGLHDLKARALLEAAGNDAGKLEDAEAAARKAIAGREDPRYVRTLVDVLDRKGELEAAVKLLEETYARTQSPALAGKLGELAFRRGEYEAALKGLGADPQPSVRALKAMAVCHGRLGNEEAMHRVLDRLEKRLSGEARIWIAHQLLSTWHEEAALKACEGLDPDETAPLRLWANAWLGKVEPADALGKEAAKEGDRSAEESLLALLTARLQARLGAKKAADARRLMAEAEAQAGRAVTPGATVDEDEAALQANSVGFMARSISYRRSRGGCWFSAGDPQITIDVRQGQSGGAVLRLGMEGTAECPVETSRWFWFNREEVSGEPTPEVMAGIIQRLLGGPGNEAWEGAEQAFARGCTALAEGKAADAKAAFAQALEAEPQWGRARLFGAVADLLGGGDAAGAAKEAAAAVAVLPDDFAGQRLLVLVHLLAGDEAGARRVAEAVGKAEEAHAPRRIERL